MTRTIVWQKWQDPLLPLVKKWAPEEDEDDPDYLAAKNTFGGDEDVDRFDSADDRRTGPCVFGPQGVIPLRESNLPGRLFNFWMGHADFPLSRPVVNTIKRVPGVETLDVFTPYRFRLGVGKAFDDKKVRKDIVAAVQPPRPPEPPARAPMDVMKKMAAGQGLVVVRRPDGRYEFAGGETNKGKA